MQGRRCLQEVFDNKNLDGITRKHIFEKIKILINGKALN